MKIKALFLFALSVMVLVLGSCSGVKLSAISSQVASIRALYLNGVPPFQAAKVRVP